MIDNIENKKPRDEKKEALCSKIVSRYDTLKAERDLLLTDWQDIADLILPRKSDILAKTTNMSEKESRIYDSTAHDALTVASAGLMSWTSPKSDKWFEYSPSKADRDNLEIRKWLRRCSEDALELLSNTNYYSERHENIIDKLAFGTSAMYVGRTDEGKVYFQNLDVGSYVFEEDFTGKADMVIREFDLTPIQAADRFGEKNLPESEKEKIKNNNNSKSKYLHYVGSIRYFKDLVKKDKPFYSCYIHCASKTIVKVGGFNSFPFIVGRYLKNIATLNKSPWGYGPGFAALPDARQANYIQKLLDIYGGKVIRPAWLVPDSFEGALDTSQDSINYYNSAVGEGGQIAPLPITGGDVGILLSRLAEKQNSIRNKYHVDLWLTISNRQYSTPPTAEEIRALQAEKLDAISPAFDRDVDEVLSPLLSRCFEIWSEDGELPLPPEEAIKGTEGNFGVVENPVITLTGKLSLAIKRMRNYNTDLQLQRIASIAQFEPTVLDRVDFDKLVVGTSFDSGLPSEYMRNDFEVADIQKKRAEAQAAAQQQQMMNEQLKAAPDNIKEEVAKNAGLI